MGLPPIQIMGPFYTIAPFKADLKRQSEQIEKAWGYAAYRTWLSRFDDIFPDTLAWMGSDCGGDTIEMRIYGNVNLTPARQKRISTRDRAGAFKCLKSSTVSNGNPQFHLTYECPWHAFFRTRKEHLLFWAYFLLHLQGGYAIDVRYSGRNTYLTTSDAADYARSLRIPQSRVCLVTLYEGGRMTGSCPGYLLSDVLANLETLARIYSL